CEHGPHLVATSRDTREGEPIVATELDSRGATLREVLGNPRMAVQDGVLVRGAAVPRAGRVDVDAVLDEQPDSIGKAVLRGPAQLLGEHFRQAESRIGQADTRAAAIMPNTVRKQE